MEGPLTIADVQAVVARASNRGLVANAAQNGHAGRRKSGIKRPEEAARGAGPAERGDVVWSHGNIRVHVHGLVLMQTEHVNVFHLDHGLGVKGPRISAVKLLGDRVAVIRVHQTSRRSRVQVMRWRSDRRLRVHAETPVAEQDAGTWYGVAPGLRDREQRLEDSCVALL